MQKYYHNTINEFPLYNWEKCQNGDLTFTRLGDECKEHTHENDVVAWKLINDSYIDIFGLSRKHKRLLQLQRDRLIAEIDFNLLDDRFAKNTITDIDDEITALFKEENNEGMDLDQTLVALSKYMGFMLDKRKLMTLEYFKMLELYGKKN